MGTYYIGKKETAPQIWKDEPYRRKLYCLISPELDPSNQDIACGLVDLPEGSQSDFRGHEEGELFFCISGKGHIRLGDEVLPLEANSAIYVPPYVEHQTINDGGAGELRLFFVLTPPFGGDRQIIEASKQKAQEDAHEGK